VTSVLVVNAGSSSLKLRQLDDDVLARHADLAPDGDLDALLRDWPPPDVVGHRVVHGGTCFTGPVLIDSTVRAELEELTDLAPLHQPKSLAALDAVTALLPDVPAVACFDTAFHTTIPIAASTYAVPREWRERWAIRRYGFHGLSHSWCASRAAQLVGRPVEQLRIVTCHLGAGASLAAVLGGRSVDTTMGFTPLDGLVMATRSGTVDPGLVLWLEEHEHLTPHDVATALEQRSGLTALAGTGDMRKVQAAASRGDPHALLALDVHTHRLVGAVATMAAATGGLDVLAFTGGVGEHSPQVRRRAARGLRFLGVEIDDVLNDTADGDGEIGDPTAPVRTVVVEAREDLQIARLTRRLLDRNGTSQRHATDRCS
jgi:acetate kinase